MEKNRKKLIGVVVIVVVLLLWFIGTKNSLVSLKEDVEMQQSRGIQIMKKKYLLKLQMLDQI